MSADDLVTVLPGDCRDLLKTLPAESVHCVVTSPPYFGLRDYNVEGQIGLEQTPEDYVEQMVAVFREVRRVLHPTGTVWLNLGDSYASSPPGNVRGVSESSGLHGAATSDKYRDTLMRGHGTKRDTSRIEGLKPKDLIGIPWLVAFALRADGWWLRSDIVWSKKAPMPESVTDRPTRSHEFVFLLTKQANYYYDAAAIAEPAGAFKPAGPNSRMDNDRDPAHGTRKQDAIGKNTYTGFNDRWRENPVSTRNKRDVWTLGPEPCQFAHFAVMPTKLVEPCILAGTSERGCCPACLAPWKRVVERERSFESGSGRSGTLPVGKSGASLQGGGATLDIRRGPVVTATTTGWEPTCSCNAGDPIPCTVLDPFAGSGTVLRVAAQHRRHGIGIELNPEYVALMQRRLTVQQGLFFENEVAV